MDGLWQLLGFTLGWLGGPGSGRAISVGEVKFSGQVLPTAKLLKFQLDPKRVIPRRLLWVMMGGSCVMAKRSLKQKILRLVYLLIMQEQRLSVNAKSRRDRVGNCFKSWE